METSVDLRKPWQRTRWAQALAIVLGYSLPAAHDAIGRIKGILRIAV